VTGRRAFEEVQGTQEFGELRRRIEELENRRIGDVEVDSK
jgi:hypothetical protein